MARNGSGTYSLPAGNPVTTGTAISSSTHNTTMSDIETALTNSVARNGEAPFTADQPMGDNKITGLKNPTARTDATNLAAIQDGKGVYAATVGGTADVITLTLSPAITAYAAGQRFSFISSGANTTNVTVNINSVGAKAITKNGTTALVANDILGSMITVIEYDGTQFQLITQANLVDKTSNQTIAGDLTLSGANTHSGANTFSGSDTHTGVKDFTGATFAGAVPVVFEGNTADAFEGSIAVADFTADRTFTFPDKDVDFGKIIDTPDIDATVAANAMTITINPGVLAFRSTTLTDGTPTVISLDSAITVVIPDTATLGSTSSEDTYYVVLAINNAGTVEAAVVNLAGHVDLDEDALISTTAIDATADSATVIYSTTARSNVAFRIMGIVKHNQSTAGTYAAAPDLVQSAYGNNYANEIAASSKTYTSPSRSAATDYVNTTGRRIMVFAQTNSAANATMICLVDGVEIQDLHTASANNAVFTSSFVVPPGSTYRVNLTNYTLVDWKEIEL